MPTSIADNTKNNPKNNCKKFINAGKVLLVMSAIGWIGDYLYSFINGDASLPTTCLFVFALWYLFSTITDQANEIRNTTHAKPNHLTGKASDIKGLVMPLSISRIDHKVPANIVPDCLLDKKFADINQVLLEIETNGIKKWPWEMPLRTISNLPQLQQIVIVASEQSHLQLAAFVALMAQIETMQKIKIFFLQKKVDHSLAVDSQPTGVGVDYGNLEELMQCMQDASKFLEPAMHRSSINIDITGGTALWSSAAILESVTRDTTYSYVDTNTKDFNVYDYQIDIDFGGLLAGI